MKRHLFIAFALISVSVLAQTEVEVKINHQIQGQNFAFNQTAQNNAGHEFQLNRMEYYLTRFTIIHDGGNETAVHDSVVFLVNADNPQNMYLGNFNVSVIEGIKFHVGVHTPTNHEDPTQYSTAHPLGPKAPSMHWGWTAGYRFIALEGMGGEQFNQIIELHGLGDDNYHETTVMTGSSTVANTEVIEIFADYARGLESISVENGVIVHGESGDAAKLCDNFRDYVFSASTQASLDEVNSTSIKVFPSPSNGAFEITWEENVQPTSISIFNQLGQQVALYQVNKNNGFQGQIHTPGTYIVVLTNEHNNTFQQKLIIQ